ncbi:hypothetical protein ABZP36_007260 [Zizania latifolia]
MEGEGDDDSSGTEVVDWVEDDGFDAGDDDDEEHGYEDEQEMMLGKRWKQKKQEIIRMQQEKEMEWNMSRVIGAEA